MGLRPQGIEQRAGTVKIRAQPEIEIGFAFARYRRGKMKDAVEDFVCERLALREKRTGTSLHARIGAKVCRR